jgi:hypothetical protein
MHTAESTPNRFARICRDERTMVYTSCPRRTISGDPKCYWNPRPGPTNSAILGAVPGASDGAAWYRVGLGRSQRGLGFGTSQISSSAAHVPEKGPTGTGPAGCGAGGAAPKPDTPVWGPVLPLLKSDTPGRGPVLPHLEPEGCSPA